MVQIKVVLARPNKCALIAIRYDGYCCRIIILQSGFISLS